MFLLFYLNNSVGNGNEKNLAGSLSQLNYEKNAQK